MRRLRVRLTSPVGGLSRGRNRRQETPPTSVLRQSLSRFSAFRVLPTVRPVDGYAGAMLLEREDSETVELIVITLCRSLDAIRGFAVSR